MLKIYTIEESEQWDTVVRSFKKYDTYWLSGYAKAFMIHGDGIPMLFHYEGDSARGINVVMKRDVSKDRKFAGILPENVYFDFSSPYGYGGWLTEGSDTKNLFSEYENWCRTNGIISEFVRFHPVIMNNKSCEDFYEMTGLGNVVTMDLSSREIIWENLTSKNRNVIRKAKKSGVKIYSGRYPEIFKIFKEIYNETMDKDSADEYYYFSDAFYDSVLNDLPQEAQIFYAVYENRVIAASIMLTVNGQMNYHLSGSVREYSSLAATNLILYEAALWGCANDCRTLYLGGGVGSGEDGLYRFKKAFYRNDDLKRFYIGKKIYSSNRYNELVELRNGLSSAYFPLYRA